MDFEAIKAAAEGYKAEMSRFLRDMISHPSESCEEKDVVMCIKAEMEKLGFDKVEIDGLGNVIGWMGEGEKIIAIDSHIDTVGIGNINNWEADPYKGYETEDVIYGRGGSDQEGGMASAVYGAKIMKEMGLIPKGYKIMVVGSVQEEDCDGIPLTKGFIALYGYSVIFKSLSPLGDSKLCFRLTKTEWFNSIFRCQTIIQFMLLSRTES